MTASKHRRLRPWVWTAIGIITGAVIACMCIACFCMTIEALTGFNPMWLLGSM